MATETTQLNVRIPTTLHDELVAYVAAEKQREGVKHGYSKNDAVQAALRAFLAGGPSNPPAEDLGPLCDRLETLMARFESFAPRSDLDRLREHDDAQEATHA